MYCTHTQAAKMHPHKNFKLKSAYDIGIFVYGSKNKTFLYFFRRFEFFYDEKNYQRNVIIEL